MPFDSSSKLIDTINVNTGNAQALQAPANSINILSGPLFLIGQGPFPQVVLGLNNITTSLGLGVGQLSGTKPFTDKSDEQSILDAYTTFVEVNQELLNILIGKAGILNDLPIVGPPIAASLRSYEGIVNSFSFGLAELVPDVKDAFSSQSSSISNTLDQAIKAYTSEV